MKHFYLFLFATILFLVVYITYSSASETAGFVPLSEDDINEFIEDKNIIPLDMENFEKEAVILFENGTYTISKQKNGELLAFFEGERPNQKISDQPPVNISIGNSAHPYISLVLEDESLIEKAHQVEVVYSPGESFYEYVQNKKGFLLIDDKRRADSSIDNFKLFIYDKDGDILFKR